MQRLYEHHKVLTYPRTDSRYLTTDIVDTLKDRIKAVNVSDYSKICNKLLKTNIKGNKSFVSIYSKGGQSTAKNLFTTKS